MIGFYVNNALMIRIFILPTLSTYIYDENVCNTLKEKFAYLFQFVIAYDVDKTSLQSMNDLDYKQPPDKTKRQISMVPWVRKTFKFNNVFLEKIYTPKAPN